MQLAQLLHQADDDTEHEPGNILQPRHVDTCLLCWSGWLQGDIEGLGGDSSWGDLLQPQYRRMMVLGTGLALMQQASGINSITFYSSSVSTPALPFTLLPCTHALP